MMIRARALRHLRALVGSVLGILCLAVSIDVHAQCAELPEPPEPTLEKCGMLNLLCNGRNSQVRKTWEDQKRRFGSPMSFDTEEESPTTQSYSVGGCRGLIVNMELTAKVLTSLRYELVAPSGTLVASEVLAPRSGRALGQPIRLPESGFYQVRLTPTSPSESRTRCLKYKKRECVNEESYSVYPTDFSVVFSGEAPSLVVGDRAEGTVTQRQPMSRRITVEGGQRLRGRVVAAGGQVTCNSEAEDGSPLSVASTASGCEVAFPEASRDASYVLALAAKSPAPTGVTIFVEKTDSRQAAAPGAPFTLQVGAETQGTLSLTAPAGSPALAQSSHEWSVDIATPGAYTLTVVPSGLAGLNVETTLYNRATEEVVIDRARVANRQTLKVRAPVAGRYVLRITPISYDAQRAQGSAKYTLLLAK